MYIVIKNIQYMYIVIKYTIHLYMYIVIKYTIYVHCYKIYNLFLRAIGVERWAFWGAFLARFAAKANTFFLQTKHKYCFYPAMSKPQKFYFHNKNSPPTTENSSHDILNSFKFVSYLTHEEVDYIIVT